jgi:hypothetical protein
MSNTQEMGAALCEKLGIPPDSVARIEVVLDANSPQPVVKVVLWPDYDFDFDWEGINAAEVHVYPETQIAVGPSEFKG